MTTTSIASTSDYQQLYDRGRMRVTHLISVIAIIAIPLNLAVFSSQYELGLVLVEICMLAVIVGSYILLLTNVISFSSHFLVVSWVVVLGLIVLHLFFYPYDPELSDVLDYFFLRGLICIAVLIPLSGVFGNTTQMMLQGGASLFYVLIYSIIHSSPFAWENLTLLLMLQVGYLLAIGFFVRHLNHFVKTNHTYKDLLHQKNQEVLDNMSYAHRIQDALLPPDSAMEDAFKDVLVWCNPSNPVASDFYWMKRQDGHIVVAVGGCVGSSLPGAMTTVICRNIMNRVVPKHDAPDELLNRTRRALVARLEDNKGESGERIFISCIRLADNELSFSGAKSKVYVVTGLTTENEENPRRSLVELSGDSNYFNSQHITSDLARQTLTLEPGNCVYMFSDGFAEQFGPEKWKSELAPKFEQLILEVSPLPLAQQKERIEAEFNAWMNGEEQVGDICLLAFRV